MNEIAKKWESTGLLDGIEEDRKDKLACKLETVGSWLITNCLDKNTPEYKKLDEIVEFLLPITVKLFKYLYPRRFPSEKWLIEDFKKYLEENRELLNDLNSYISMDGNERFIELYCDKKQEEFKNSHVEVDLLTPDEVKNLGEKFGFGYEPNESKCQIHNAGPIYTTYEWDNSGIIKVHPPIWEYDSISAGHFIIKKEEFMDGICLRNVYKFIHNFRAYHPKDGDYTSNRGFFHAHSRIHIVGHTKMTVEEIEERYKKYGS